MDPEAYSWFQSVDSDHSGYISIKEKELAGTMCDRIMDSAAGFQADCLVTACPLCKYNLNKTGKLPVVYFTELLAEALGVKEAAQ